MLFICGLGVCTRRNKKCSQEEEDKHLEFLQILPRMLGGQMSEVLVIYQKMSKKENC